MSQQQHLTQTKLQSLDMHDTLKKALNQHGFEYCTPIQEKALPLALEGHDVAGQAQTGTGKTAAFLLATFNHILNHPLQNKKKNQPRALILAPTRELAIQIHKDACELNGTANLKLGLAYGGTGYESQRDEIGQGVDILIGTPGRLIDYFKQKVFNLQAIEVAVLDEADRMFDLGFIKDIRYLFRRMSVPDKRLNLLFSATLSHRVLELAYEHMNQPQLIKIEAENITADKVRQQLFHVSNSEKIPLMLGLLRRHDPKRTLVFVNTKRMADKLVRTLNANGLSASVISGDVPQQKRQRLMDQFKEGNLPLLVATDVAARGLHIPHVSHVFNFDLPQDAEDYVHRIGRTARAGAEGDAISLCCETYVYSLPDIEKYIGQKLPVEVPDEELMARDVIEPRRPKKKHHHSKHAKGKRSTGRKSR